MRLLEVVEALPFSRDPDPNPDATPPVGAKPLVEEEEEEEEEEAT